MNSLINIQNLTKRFKKTVILDDINLSINEGEIFGIIGMSGSGKTTMLNSLIGFLEPDEGDILFLSDDHNYKSIHKNQIELSKMFGFATQAASFYPRLTVEENLLHFGSLYHLPKKINKSNADKLLNLTGLKNAREVLAKNISGGMEKKLSVACSLMHKPKVLILDEPTADLDPLSREDTWNMLKNINKMGTTIIVASHFLDELEQVCDRVAILYDKKIIAVGSPNELKDKYFKYEEINLRTNPGDYKSLVSSLRLKDYKIKDSGLIMYSSDSEILLGKVLASIKRNKEKLISVHVTKPSLAEIFESLKK